MNNPIKTSNLRIYFNDKIVHCCARLELTATTDSELFYCNFVLADGDDIITGKGYLERVIQEAFYIRVIDGDDDFSNQYLRKLYT